MDVADEVLDGAEVVAQEREVGSTVGACKDGPGVIGGDALTVDREAGDGRTEGALDRELGGR